MAVYNSSFGLNQDDSDITIINPSIIHENNDDYVNNTYVPIITRLKQANNSSENRQITNSNDDKSNGKNEYIFVDHNPKEVANKLEQMLRYYIQDLERDTNSQIDCDQQLVIRLMDLIRPAHAQDQQKNIELDKITERIASLHDQRHVEQKEKIEQLRTEICQLNKMLLSVRNEHSMYNGDSINPSIQTTTYPKHSLFDQDQWTEIEDDAKKLQEIVQTQKQQINEIVTLISQTATAPTSLNPTFVSLNNSQDDVNNQQQTTAPTGMNIINTLLKKIHDITGQQTQPEQPVVNPIPQETTLENHSPGISPTNSLATLTLTTFQSSMDNQTERTPEPQEREIEQPNPIREEPHAPIEIPVTIIPSNETKKCPVCNHEFALTSTDIEMYDHIENCLFPAVPKTQPTQYECPNCNRHYPGDDENTYLQHLTDCYNREI